MNKYRAKRPLKEREKTMNNETKTSPPRFFITTTTLMRGHGFHPACIDAWLGIHGSCPLCRCMEILGFGNGDGDEDGDGGGEEEDDGEKSKWGVV